jgi:glutamate carboxypeptidase
MDTNPRGARSRPARHETEPLLNPRDLLAYCSAHAESMMRNLRKAVEIESPTHSKAAVTKMAEYCAREFQKAGGVVQMHRHVQAGCALTAEFWGMARKQKPILLLGHTDTVWEAGTLDEMPFRLLGGRAYGPGILDMKSGIIIALWAIRALRATGIQPRSPVHFFLNADEETGSMAFRSRLLAEARRARACLVLEPAAPGGALKTSRKGVGIFALTAHGRSAHAGINPDAGINAISELARQIVKIEGFARRHSHNASRPGLTSHPGLTINVGIVHGGSRSNVVPENATASIDVRVARPRDGDWIDRQMRSLRPVQRGARLEITGGMNRPPLERRNSAGLFRRACELALQLGFEVREASTGGGSDGSFAAALGVPTLDGLGGVGDGAHARHEHILTREIPRRAALLAALIAAI